MNYHKSMKLEKHEIIIRFKFRLFYFRAFEISWFRDYLFWVLAFGI
jgi:hypothetical protein